MDPMSHNCAERTLHGRKCVWQLKTKDEGQRVLGERSQPYTEIEGKQQMELTRSRMVSAKLLSNCDFVLINRTRRVHYLMRFYASQQGLLSLNC
jgi:hypothetical protein